MPANSKHPGDILLWLEKVIDSCVTAKQVNNCRFLLRRFEDMIDYDNPIRYENHRLTVKINDKFYDLITKEIELKTK